MDNQIHDRVQLPVAHPKGQQGEHVVGGVKGGRADEQVAQGAVIALVSVIFLISCTRFSRLKLRKSFLSPYYPA